MAELWLLRHAKAVGQQEPDRKRPLAEKGEAAMREVASWAAEQGLAPALILCSSAARTRQTLAILRPALGGKHEIRFEDGLYLADAERMLARLRRVPAKCESVLVVGHNPGLHELAVLLMAPGAGKPGKHLASEMPTGALAGFEVEGPWGVLAPHEARLTHFVTPKDL
jgi:phosphohistidine phosphatase